MCLLQLPESWHEACTTSVNLALAGLFKHPLKGSSPSQDNRQLEISEISAEIKALAKELNIPIIVIAQLNRQPELRGNGKPRLSDLRESGSIEQDADVVGLLVRAEYYETDGS
jgi:replicative DNA helicase